MTEPLQSVHKDSAVQPPKTILILAITECNVSLLSCLRSSSTLSPQIISLQPGALLKYCLHYPREAAFGLLCFRG